MGIVTKIGDWISGMFVSPAMFAFLALVPIIILLYLLKLRRTEVIVPSTLLWRNSMEDLTANAPFQKLRKNLLMFLQILIIFIVATALARPFTWTDSLGGSNLCLIIDRSASMQTVEGERTRLEIAREKALEMVDQLRDGDRMMIVSFGSTADVLSELTDDRRRLREVIKSIEPSDTRTVIRDVALMARSLAPDNPDVPGVVSNPRLVLVSDGVISDPDQLGSLAMDMRFLQIGETSDNAGITAFSVRDPINGRGRRECFALVHNEADKPLRTTMSLYHDDDMIAVREVEVPPLDDGEFLFEIPKLEGGALRVELDHEDALDVDNVAWLVFRPESRIKILLVSQADSAGAYFLKRVLSLDGRVELSEVEPGNFSDTGERDLIIFDGWSPPTLPRGNLLFINAIPPIPGVNAAGTLNNPPILSRDQRHMLTRFLNPENVLIERAMKLRVPPGTQNVVTTTGGPLIADLSVEGRRIAVIGFDIADSNWPLRLSFPLFIQNLLAWLHRSEASGGVSIPTGIPITIMPNPAVENAVVHTPGGDEIEMRLDPLRPVYFGATERVGIYRVDRGTEHADIHAVNLLDANESAIKPADKLQLGRGEAVAERGNVKQDRELWRWFVLAGLMVLMIEWWIYSRRAWM